MDDPFQRRWYMRQVLLYGRAEDLEELDLDIFTVEEPLIAPFSHRMESVFRDEGWGVNLIRRFASYVELLLSQGEEELRIDLALDTPFRFESPLLSEYGVWVNDCEDLKAERVLAYYGRAEPRDTVDLYFILSRESLDILIALASEKDPGFDLYWLAVALNEAERFPDEIECWSVLPLSFPARSTIILTCSTSWSAWGAGLPARSDHV